MSRMEEAGEGGSRRLGTVLQAEEPARPKAGREHTWPDRGPPGRPVGRERRSPSVAGATPGRALWEHGGDFGFHSG